MLPKATRPGWALAWLAKDLKSVTGSAADTTRYRLTSAMLLTGTRSFLGSWPSL